MCKASFGLFILSLSKCDSKLISFSRMNKRMISRCHRYLMRSEIVDLKAEKTAVSDSSDDGQQKHRCRVMMIYDLSITNSNR